MKQSNFLKLIDNVLMIINIIFLPALLMSNLKYDKIHNIYKKVDNQK